MAKNNIAQSEHLFQDLDLQILAIEQLILKLLVAYGEIFTDWRHLASVMGYKFLPIDQ